ncbi:hypothetical protein MRX96_009571 [Rhipicephalus microplus]
MHRFSETKTARSQSPAFRALLLEKACQRSSARPTHFFLFRVKTEESGDRNRTLTAHRSPSPQFYDVARPGNEKKQGKGSIRTTTESRQMSSAKKVKWERVKQKQERKER